MFFFVKRARTKCHILSRLSKGSRRLVQTTSFVKYGAHIIIQALKKTQNIFPIFSTINVHSMLKYDESSWLWFFLASNFLVFFVLNQTIIISKLKFDPSFSFHIIMLDFSCIQHKCFVSSVVKILSHFLSIFRANT